MIGTSINITIKEQNMASKLVEKLIATGAGAKAIQAGKRQGK